MKKILKFSFMLALVIMLASCGGSSSSSGGGDPVDLSPDTPPGEPG